MGVMNIGIRGIFVSFAGALVSRHLLEHSMMGDRRTERRRKIQRVEKRIVQRMEDSKRLPTRHSWRTLVLGEDESPIGRKCTKWSVFYLDCTRKYL